MTELNFDDFDHDSHLRRTFELAREAADRGDKPFGSVLVRDDTVIMTDSNREVTEDDIQRHPELHLAYRAYRELDPDERAETVMYTSTEPCPMCAGGMAKAGFDRVVYSVGSDEIAAFTGNEPSVDGEAHGPTAPMAGEKAVILKATDVRLAVRTRALVL